MAEKDILFILGLGTGFVLNAQRAHTRVLNIFKGRNFHFFEAGWEDLDKPESAEDKFKRLESFYDKSGRPGIIYANSAGASLGARLLIERTGEIESCHLVCGKVLGASKIGDEFKQRAPAIEGSVIASEEAVSGITDEQAKKIYCYVPRDRKDDGVIEVVDMIVPGANIVELPSLSHVPAIIHAARHILPKL